MEGGSTFGGIFDDDSWMEDVLEGVKGTFGVDW